MEVLKNIEDDGVKGQVGLNELEVRSDERNMLDYHYKIMYIFCS